MPNPRNQNPAVSGAINATPCPHCGKRNDLRTLQEEQLLDTGAILDCDYCKRLYEVIRIAPVTVVTVRAAAQGALANRVRHNPGQMPAARQATTLSPAQTRRLLKGR